MIKNTRLPEMPSNDCKMISDIKKLPDINILDLNRPQTIHLLDQKYYWEVIGNRINFFQKQKLGCLPEDPLENNGLPPFYKDKIDIMSHYYFAIFELVIEAFLVIKSAAIAEGRTFPFDDARALFVQICREDAADGLADLLSNELNQGFDLTGLRENLRMWQKFYRGKYAKSEEILSWLQKGKWSDFWIFAIWQFREKEYKTFWKKFKDSHRAMCRFMDGKDYPAGTINMVKWNAGKPFWSSTGRPVESWVVPYKSTILNIS